MGSDQHIAALYRRARMLCSRNRQDGGVSCEPTVRPTTRGRLTRRHVTERHHGHGMLTVSSDEKPVNYHTNCSEDLLKRSEDNKGVSERGWVRSKVNR